MAKISTGGCVVVKKGTRSRRTIMISREGKSFRQGWAVASQLSREKRSRKNGHLANHSETRKGKQQERRKRSQQKRFEYFGKAD